MLSHHRAIGLAGLAEGYLVTNLPAIQTRVRSDTAAHRRQLPYSDAVP